MIINEEDIEIDYSDYSLGELQEIIGDLEDAPQDKRKKKEYKEYKAKMNALFDIYNDKANTKIYKTIK